MELPLIIRQLTKSDQIGHLLLAPLKDVSLPSLVLNNKSSIFICDFLEDSGLQITKKLTVPNQSILKISSCELDDLLHCLVVLTEFNELFFIMYDTDISDFFVRYYNPFRNLVDNSSIVDTENPIIISNDKYILVHTRRLILVVLSKEEIDQFKEKSIFYPFNKYGVVNISFISSNRFQMISRNSSFQYSLTVFEIADDDRISVIKDYNPFKEVPKQLVTMGKLSLVICDGTHLLYPPIGYKISKDTMDKNIKLTRVSVFKILDKELNNVQSFQIIDSNRVLILTDSGEIYMELMQFSELENEIKLQNWDLIKLGNLSPSSKILHINDNLFLNYSKEFKNCFFKINAKEPYIEILNYFQLHQFFERKSILSQELHQNVESSPVVDINRIKLINCQLFIKVQSTVSTSVVSFKFPQYLSSSLQTYKTGRILKWFNDGDYIMYQPYNSSDINVVKFHNNSFQLIGVYIFRGEEDIRYCYFQNNTLIIVTAKAIIHNCVDIFYECTNDESILLSDLVDGQVTFVTNDHKVHQPNKTYLEPGIVCLCVSKTHTVLGFEDGTLKIDGIRKLISANAITKIIIKEDYILAVDSSFKIFVVKDEQTVEFPIDKGFEIFDVKDSNEFIIKNDEQLTLNSIVHDKLETRLLKFSTIPDYFTVSDNNFVCYNQNKLEASEIQVTPDEKRLQFYSDELIKKSLLLRVDTKFPVLVLITLQKNTSYIKMVDLQSFKIIDSLNLDSGEEIMDIIRTDFEISLEDDFLKDMDLTDRDLSLVQLELYNNGFLVNTCETLDDGRTINFLKLFTIGSDMKFKFHYLLQNQQVNLNLDSFKLLNFNNFIISSGTFISFFKIGINDKFTTDKNVKEINKNNFFQNSIFKLYPVPNARHHRAEVFNNDLKKLDDHHIVVSDVLKGLTFYKITSKNDNDISVRKLKMENCPLSLKDKIVLLMEVVHTTDQDFLISVDTFCNVFITGYTISQKTVKLRTFMQFNIGIFQINVIISLELFESHLCLLGCSNGEVLVLDIHNKNIEQETINQLSKTRYEILQSQSVFIQSILYSQYLRRYGLVRPSPDQLFGGQTDVGRLVDLRFFENGEAQKVDDIQELELYDLSKLRI